MSEKLSKADDDDPSDKSAESSDAATDDSARSGIKPVVKNNDHATPAVTSAPKENSLKSGVALAQPRNDSAKQIENDADDLTLPHTVSSGETLETIAMVWNLTVNRLKEANNLKDDKVTPGQKLKIPLND
jgi:LysM repeat protein